MQQLLANPKNLHKRVMFHVSFYCCFFFWYCASLSSCLAIFEVSPHLFYVTPYYSHALHLVAFTPCTLLFSCFAPCCSRASLHFIVGPYSYHITPCCFHPLLHLFVMRCSFCIVPYCFYSRTLLRSFSHLAIRATLLFTPCYLAIAPCCSTLLVARPCCPTIVLCYSPFSSTSFPPYPIVVLLHVLTITPYCFALFVGIPSSLSCVGGKAWSNTNKLHPTTKLFYFLQLLSFFFPFFCFVLCLFFCHFCFELNTFCFIVICDF